MIATETQPVRTSPDAVRLRAVTTPFDPPAGAVTVATPSCSCCCCCCLVTLSGMTAFTAATGHHRALGNGRSNAGPALVGLLAVPLGLLAGVVAPDGLGWARLAIGAIVTLLVALGSGLLAGDRGVAAAGRAAVIAAVTAAALVAEVYIALGTAFIFELAAPFAVWCALLAARSMSGSPATLPEPPFPPAPSSFPPPSPPPPPGSPW